MAYNFDFLGDDVLGGPEYQVPNTGMDKLSTLGQLGSNTFGDLFSDPNFIRAIGEVGAGIGGQGSIGDILGTAGSTLTRRKAAQGAAAKTAGRQQNFQQQLIQALSSGSLLSPVEQNDRFDSATFDGNGGATLKFKNTPKQPGFEGEQSALEADRGISSLPDFFKASLG